MDNNLLGGKLIATGSRSCIINPNIKCKNNRNKKRDKKTISKISFGDEAEENSIREKTINDMIKRIPGYKKWALIFDDMCKPPSYNDSLKIDKDINKCIKEEDTYELHGGIESKKNELFEDSIMLIGEFGGETFGDYFNKKFSEINMMKDLEREFLILMKKMKDIFKGLVDLNAYEISHLDIKQNNIVISKKNFKFIDFGISSKFNDIEHFLTRGYHEFRTDRIYYWYPIEYIYSSASNEELELEEEKVYEDGIQDYRKHMDSIYEIYTYLGIDIESFINDLLKKYKNMDKKEFFYNEYYDIIRSIDTYSFGMLVPMMLYNQDLLENAHKSKLLTEFLNIFALMLEPHYKDRISINDAYVLFEQLLEKYSPSKKKSKKKSRKSKKKKSKKKK